MGGINTGVNCPGGKCQGTLPPISIVREVTLWRVIVRGAIGIGGNCPGGDCLGAIGIGGTCPAGNCPGGTYLVLF